MKQDDYNDIRQHYFTYLYDTVCGGRVVVDTYYDLFAALYATPFKTFVPMDVNREIDGMYLRYRFQNAIKQDNILNGYSIDEIDEALSGPCSVLEMMIALAIKCEEEITSDPNYGNRTQQWFWNMIANLGLHGMQDGSFDEDKFNEIMNIFIERKYSYDGKGGLFYVRNSPFDMRVLEIWKQLKVYLNSFIY